MKLFTIAKIEIKKSFEGVLKLSIFMGLFVFLISSMFDPELFAGMEDFLDAYPDAFKDMLGSALNLSTFGGFYTVEFLSMIWIWLGIYFILKAAQDIPSTIENKTIDLILSKPLKRWEFVLGRYMRFIFSILLVFLIIGFLTFLMVVILPNLQNEELDFLEFFVALSLSFLFVVSLTTTAFFFSVFLNRKRATGISFSVMIVFFIIGTFYRNFEGIIKEFKWLSLFFYYDPARILVSHKYGNVLIRDFLVLIGYSVVLVIASIKIFNERDIPV